MTRSHPEVGSPGALPAPADGWLARLGRWCLRRRWWVIGGWLAAVVVGLGSGAPLFDRLVDSEGPSSLESVAATEVLAAEQNRGGGVVGLVDGVQVRSPRVRTEVQRVASRIRSIRGVSAVATPYSGGQAAAGGTAGGPALATKDGRTLLIQVTLARQRPAALAAAAQAVTVELRHGQTRLVAAGQSSARVRVGGDTAILQQANDAIRADLARGENVSLGISLVVLVVVFGGVFAAGVPVLVALVSVAAVTAVLLLFTMFTDVGTNAVTVATLMGLGLSIDYSLLLVNRYREELGAGYGPLDAIGNAWATAGRTIMFSALTVAASLVGMLVFGITGLSALGLAGMAIAVVAMIASLTFTAALLGMVLRWIRPPRHGTRSVVRPGEGGEESGLFARLSRWVQRRPLVVALATSAALLAAGIPVLSTTVRLDTVGSLPRSIEAVQVTDELTGRFGVPPAAAVTVVARIPPSALDEWARGWLSDPIVRRVRPAVAVSADTAMVEFDVRDDPQSAPVWSLVDRMRAQRPSYADMWVTGDAAILRDLRELIMRRLPLAAGVTVAAMLVLLFLMTGSLVVPVKAVLMNVVSLGATFGVMSAVFEHGFLAGPLDATTVGGFNPLFLIIVFGFAFGLSMDYEVFLLARIKEYVDDGVEPGAAVRWGLQQTGRIITSAALLMIVVFGAFAAAKMSAVEQIGLGMAAAVAIDATLVRCVLVPATMTLLGRRNWWAPPLLVRIHGRLGLSEGGTQRRDNARGVPLPSITTAVDHPGATVESARRQVVAEANAGEGPLGTGGPDLETAVAAPP